ncbi:MAG: hypothetical protein ACKV22_16600 [Bryobacteraceae bacterium]
MAIYLWPSPLVWTHMAGPTLLFETRVGITRRVPDQVARTLSTPELVSAMGFEQVGFGGLPGQGISGFLGIGGGQLFSIPFTAWQGEEKVTKTAGAHYLKAGFGLFRYRLDIALSAIGGGGRSYDGNLTRQINAPSSTSVEQAMAQFLLGLPSSISGTNIDAGSDRFRPRGNSYYAFVQDDWRVSSRLTLNLGVRYDLLLPPTFSNGFGGAYFDLKDGTPVYVANAKVPEGCCPYATRLSPRKGLYERDPYNLGPRLGFAYRPFGDRFALRGGYGVYFDSGIQGNVAFGAALTSPFSRAASILVDRDEKNPRNFLPINYNVIVARGSFPTPAAFTGFNQDFKTGMVQQWNLSIDRQLTRSTSLSLSYVGNKGDRLLDVGVAVNIPTPGPGAVQARRPFPLFGSVLQYSSYGRNHYHSLQFQLKQNLARGFSGLLGYTWGKSTGVLNAGNGNASLPNAFYQNQYDRQADYSVTSAHVPHRVVFSGVYQVALPAESLFPRALIRDWQIAGVYTIQSGFPFSPLLAADIANIGSDRNNPRADYLGGGSPNLSRDRRNTSRFFRTDLFANPAQFTFGNAGRNILTGDTTQNVDLVISRFFPIREDHRIEFRAEAYNLANRVTLAFPNFRLGSPGFGSVTAQQNFGRQIQLALKYSF